MAILKSLGKTLLGIVQIGWVVKFADDSFKITKRINQIKYGMRALIVARRVLNVAGQH